MGVPGSMRRGQRKKMPLELMSCVLSAARPVSGLPAMVRTQSGKRQIGAHVGAAFAGASHRVRGHPGNSSRP